jgi:dTDP-4-amino-4,6-dideoxygalactose transaminase
MKVPMLDLSMQYRYLKNAIDEALGKVMHSSTFILGENVRMLEQSIAAYSHTKYGIGVANGSDALHISLTACGVGSGDEVITTAFTFFATAGSIVRTGAKPVFVDIQPHTFNIDPGLIEEKITPKTKAIVPVHLYGQVADMEAVALSRKMGRRYLL